MPLQTPAQRFEAPHVKFHPRWFKISSDNTGAVTTWYHPDPKEVIQRWLKAIQDPIWMRLFEIMESPRITAHRVHLPPKKQRPNSSEF